MKTTPRGIEAQLWLAPLLAASTFCANAEVSWHGYAEINGRSTSGERNWIEGGSQVLGAGDGVGAEARLGLELRGESRFSAHVSVLGHAGSSEDLGRKGGLLEAFVDYGDLVTDGYRVRTGLQFSGTSLENVEAFWQSPYTLSLSALNSWIGEEFRPIGIDVSRRFNAADGTSWDFAANLYGGNDTSAALLAWRGFAVHNRLSAYGEALPLMPLPSLQDPSAFGRQRPDGSQPLGPDLDGRIGYALRSRFNFVDGGGIRLAYTDNRGDRFLYNDEYSWHTRFAVLGFDYRLGNDWTLLGELMHGRTNMGFGPGANVSFDLDASYLLLSRAYQSWTYSVRLENFHLGERDRSVGELNSQNGNGITFAVINNLGDWRFGVEAQYFDINRPGNLEFAGDPDQGGSSLTLVARRYF